MGPRLRIMSGRGGCEVGIGQPTTHINATPAELSVGPSFKEEWYAELRTTGCDVVYGNGLPFG